LTANERGPGVWERAGESLKSRVLGYVAELNISSECEEIVEDRDTILESWI